jgi:hypothetical protein
MLLVQLRPGWMLSAGISSPCAAVCCSVWCLVIGAHCHTVFRAHFAGAHAVGSAVFARTLWTTCIGVVANEQG